MADTLTDQQITELCARAAGVCVYDNGRQQLWVGKDAREAYAIMKMYNPLHNRAQAMELLEKLRLRVLPFVSKNLWLAETTLERLGVTDSSILRAICLCAARVQLEKEKQRG